jgi:hypothetical protein
MNQLGSDIGCRTIRWRSSDANLIEGARNARHDNAATTTCVAHDDSMPRDESQRGKTATNCGEPRNTRRKSWQHTNKKEP